MKTFRVVAALAVLSGCLDFAKAREECVASGNCLGTLAPVTVVSTDPANQGTQIPVGTILGATFSRAMDPGSVKVVIAPAVGLGSLLWEDDDKRFTVMFTSALAYSTQYSVTLTGRSQDGVALGEDAKFSFTTDEEPDKVAPTLTATSPQSGTQNVPVDFKLVLTFSEGMDPSSVVLTSQPPYLFGTPGWSGDGRTATFDMPGGNLMAMTDYVVQIDGRDLALNALTGIKTVTFKTAVPPDNTAPVVVGTSPAQGATDVSVTTTPSVTFSETMNAATVSTSFMVTPAIPGGCSILPDATGTLFTCNHGQPLAESTTYTVTMGTGAKDGAMNSLAQPFSFSFTTGVIPDTTPPSIVSTDPISNASGATQTPTFKVTFSEPMDKASTEGAFSIPQPGGVPTGVTFAWDTAGTTMTATLPPGFSFPYGTDILWQIGTGAKDLAQNALPSLQAFAVRVRRQATIDISASTGTWDDGYLDFVAFPVVAGTTELRVGDSNINREQRGVVSFDLGSTQIPSNAFNVLTATLTMRQTAIAGTPYANARAYVFAINMTAPLSSDDFDSAHICLGTAIQCSTGTNCQGRLLSSSTTLAGYTVSNLGSFVNSGFLGANKRASFRIEMRQWQAMLIGCPLRTADNDGAWDYAVFASGDAALGDRPKLTVTYTYP